MAYTPKQGDIIKIDLNPTRGREQQGRRPALVVSNAGYNRFTRGLAMVCPITHSDKNLPLQPKLDERTTTKGVVMTDQVKALDLAERNVEFIEQIPTDILSEVCDIVGGYSEMDKR